jgi:hypothetical protein
MLYLVLLGCPPPSPQPAYICKADANWVSSPTQPSDVGEEKPLEVSHIFKYLQ